MSQAYYNGRSNFSKPSTSTASKGLGTSPTKRPNKNQKTPKQCANPIFEQWLIEWREEAVLKNSKMQYVFSKALNSLRKYPLPLTSGRECIMLEFFGQTLCKMIDVKLSKEPGLNLTGDTTRLADVIDIPSPEASKANSKKSKSKSSVKNRDSQSDNEEDDELPNAKKKKKGSGKTKNYIPAYRSGAYALLVSMFRKEEIPGYRGFMLKSELLREAQDYCDSSFAKPDNPNSKYTAWSSMATLLNKELILRQGNPAKFMLTIEGRELAAKLLNVNLGSRVHNLAAAVATTSDDDEIESNSQSEISNEQFARFCLEPGQFEIILCVDNGETNAKGKKEEVIGELNKNGVPLQVMKLNIGDFVWICRKNDQGLAQQQPQRRLTVTRSAQELVLPFVVERKRADDFASSIKDGRFHEQKHRLEKCLLQPIYLMESYGSGDWGLADGALTQALANTQITNQFLIQETNSIKDTCAFLTHMTRNLSKLYLNKRISSCSREEWPSLKDSAQTYLLNFEDFNEFSNKAKNWTVSEMFAKHLLRLRGLSVERAQAIIQRYPTPHSLFLAYDECQNEKEKESLLAALHFGNGGRTIGPAISKTISKLYTSKTFP